MSVQGDFSIQEYAAWLSELGEGSLNDEDDNVILPEMLLCSSNDIGSLIDHAYPSIHTAHSDHYFQERCILAPFDREVEEINTIALKRFPGPLRDSSWSVDQALDPQMEESAPFEVLHGITPPGFPLGQLSLKVGCPVILLRDLPGGKGTRNGSRGIVTDIAVRVLQLRMLSGEVVLVPRVPHTSAELRRLQFPVALAFAMTIEKARGQSFSTVGVDLRIPCFRRGQLRLALSRANSPAGIKCIVDSDAEEEGETKNIV